MAARLAAPSQGSGAGGGTSPTAVREVIVIPEISNSIHLQHAIQQVSSTVVEVNGDSSGHSSPATDAQHTYITVAMDPWLSEENHPQVKQEVNSETESEGGNGVNYHVQYVEPQEIYTQNHQNHLESLRTYPVYGVTSETVAGEEGAGWGGAAGAEYAAYGVVVAGDEAEAPASPNTPAPPPPRMPPATVQWLLEHYETAEGVSLPRSTLYTHYLRHCAAHRLEPVNAASFGKLIRSVFIGLRTRRLGTRGNSKYHYYGIRAKGDIDAHHQLEALDEKTELQEQPESVEREHERVEREPEPGGGAVAASLAGINYRQYLDAVSPPEPPELTVEDATDAEANAEMLQALRTQHREFGAELLEAVASLDAGAVERARRGLWRRGAATGRRALWRLTARREGAAWLRRADLRLYQCAVQMLLPEVLRAIPPQLTQAIRNFAKGIEGALTAGGAGVPATAARAQASAASAMAAALRRYTSLNHLAQAARAVLANHLQIHQMQSDLNRVDFRVVREQAAWACSCSSVATAQRLETDFKSTLGRGASLEQWASWLESCVRAALAVHERRPDFAARARRLLLDWSFYSSLVIRELTLRSAASFGSFHLIRLLYDEYVSYLIERRVAAHQDVEPIAVMQRVPEEVEDLPALPPAPAPVADEEEEEWDWGDEDEDEEPAECKKRKMIE